MNPPAKLNIWRPFRARLLWIGTWG